MKKFLKLIGIILLILCIFLLIHTIRNYIIISNLQSKIKEYSSNFHVTTVSKDSSNMVTTINHYQKGDDYVSKTERTSEDGIVVKMSLYKNGDSGNQYVETPNEKVASLKAWVTFDNMLMLNNGIETDSKFEMILYCFLARISKEIYSDKLCYKINLPKRELYIEKDTGLLIGEIDENNIITKEYEFDKVDDSIFIEPDISEYEVHEPNN